MEKIFTILLMLVLLSPPVLANKKATDEVAEAIIDLVTDKQTELKKYLALHYNAAIFLSHLLKLDNIPGLPSSEHGEFKSNTKESDLENLKISFPFKSDFIIALESEKEYEYFYTIIKKSEEGMWKVGNAFKIHKGTKEHSSLPLPKHSQILEANRLLVTEETN